MKFDLGDERPLSSTLTWREPDNYLKWDLMEYVNDDDWYEIGINLSVEDGTPMENIEWIVRSELDKREWKSGLWKNSVMKRMLRKIGELME